MKLSTQITFKCDEELKKKLETIAAKERRPTSALIKIVLEDFVQDYEKKHAENQR